MTLLRVCLENYRRLKFVELALTHGLTLIAAPNEQGKSTLLEAIHRGLFLRARATGQVLEAMQSRHGGVPKVQIEFEAGGQTYFLIKTFAGARGTAQLQPKSGAVLRDQAAEDELARLLGVSGLIGGGGALGALERRWAHLWIWQGRSASDPTGALEESGADLARRLQTMGGAAVVQSHLDRKVHEAIQREVESLVKGRSGEPKAGTKWAAVRERLEALSVREQELRQEVANLKAAMQGKIEADRDLAASGPAICQAEEQLAKTRSDREQIEALRRELAPLEVELRAAESEQTRLAKWLAEVEEAKAALPVRSKERDDRFHAEAMRRGAVQAAEQQVADLERRLAEARQIFELIRWQRDVAEAEAIERREREELARWEKQRAEVERAAAALQERERRLAAIPEISPSDLSRLEQLWKEVVTAETGVSAMATGVEVRQSADGCTVGGLPVQTGEELRFSQPFAICTESGLDLWVVPGGGDSLEKANQAMQQARDALRAALTEAGVESVEAAREKLIQRQVLAQEIETEKKRWEEAGAEFIAERHAAAQQAVAKAVARAEVLKGEQRGPLAVVSDEALRAAEDKGRGLEQELALARARHQELSRAWMEAREALQAADQALQLVQTRLETLAQAGGELEGVAARQAELAVNIQNLQRKQEATKQKLELIGAANIEERLVMRERALAQARKAAEDARVRQGQALAVLGQATVRDPFSALEETRQMRELAREEEAREAARVRALQCLLGLFDAQQHQLQKQFTQPLVERAAGYLELVFGRGTKVDANFEQGKFRDLMLIRPNAPTFAFAELSMGAREQVGLAFRLAAAEVLAAAHDGCLPLALDDAFTHSDSTRMASLREMLHRAANRGLQVIVATCHPDRYRGMGAAEVRLPR